MNILEFSAFCFVVTGIRLILVQMKFFNCASTTLKSRNYLN